VFIEAAGKTWIVEEQPLAWDHSTGGGSVSGVIFRNRDYDSDELHVRWVLTPPRLTRRLAEELFEIAAVRSWRDPRDARLYELRIEAGSTSVPPGSATPLAVLRFDSGGRAVETPWTLAKALGWATDQELTCLLDRAVGARLPGRLPER
jgi:hypothetical protein